MDSPAKSCSLIVLPAQARVSSPVNRMLRTRDAFSYDAPAALIPEKVAAEGFKEIEINDKEKGIYDVLLYSFL